MPARRQLEFPIRSDPGALQRQLEFPICEPDVIIEAPSQHGGLMITDAQVRMLRRLDHHGAAKELAAVKAGMDAKTARKYRRLGKLPSEVNIMDRIWRTRPDPFAEVWPRARSAAPAQPRPGSQDALWPTCNARFRAASPTVNCGPCSGGSSSGVPRTGRPRRSFFAQVHRSRPPGCQRLHALHRAWA